MVKRVLLLWLLLIAPAQAALMRPMNIDQLTAGSERIFLGTVLSNELDTSDPSGLLAIRTRFRVEEIYKGPVSSEATSRQVAKRGPGGKLSPLFDGLPVFTAGERVVVFLSAISGRGFNSPFALGQGVFHFLNPGKPAASPIASEYGNRSLMLGVTNTRTLGRIRALGLKSVVGGGSSLTLAQLKDLVAASMGGAK
jgi:hypothetical protein